MSHAELLNPSAFVFPNVLPNTFLGRTFGNTKADEFSGCVLQSFQTHTQYTFLGKILPVTQQLSWQYYNFHGCLPKT